MPRAYTEEFLKEVYDYMQETQLGVSAVARYFNVDRGTLAKRLKEHYDNVISRPDGKLPVNSNYFETIDTEHKAYWLGFLTADGYVSESKIELCLAEIDRNHVEQFKSDIESQHKVGLKQTKLNGKTFKSYRIHIKDKKLGDDLNKLGLTSNKSYDAHIPFSMIPNNLLKHYVRGLMDGDGCVYHRNDNGLLGVIICTTASESMVNDITTLIKQELNIDVKYVNDSHNIVDVCLYKQEDIKTFYNWIYDNSSIYLQRKYDKFAVLRTSHKDS